MASYNKITLVGNVGRDPELKQVANNKVVEFSIAINEPARGQQPEKTEWYRVTFWDRRAETIAQYVRKGTQILVEGRLAVRSYQDNTGKDRYSLEVTGTDFVLLGSKADNQEGGGAPGSYQQAAPENSFQRSAAPPAPPAPKPPVAAATEEDDLPF